MASEKLKEIHISMDSQAFPRTMLYNRFMVEQFGPVRIFYFALVDEEDYVRDSYACAIDEETIQRQKDDLLNYVARAGSSTPIETSPWRPKLSTIHGIDVANVIRAARVGRLSELRLFNYSIGDVLDRQREGGKTVQAIPVALLCCEEGLQRTMFLSLYSEEKAPKNAKKR